MNDWVSIVFNSDYGPTFVGGTTTIVFIMFLSFAIGNFIGYVYMWSHEAISYSRTFVASIAALPVIISVMMIVMAGNLLIAFGMLAVFGVIRFRNVLKDTRDTTFILWTVMEGVCVGTMRFSTALLGALGVGAAFLYLRLVSFGTRHQAGDAVADALPRRRPPEQRWPQPAAGHGLSRQARRVDQRAAGKRRRCRHGVPRADG